MPSLDQGRFLDEALASLFSQDVPIEVFVADAGSTDGSLEVIRKWEGRLAGWRSHADAGQAAAVNESLRKGSAPYVCWLNSDDALLPGGLRRLVEPLERNPAAPMAYGRVWNHDEATGRRSPVPVFAFREWLMASFCLVSQPGTLIRRSCWEAVGGLDESLHMAMDYDLWWRLFKRFGAPLFVPEFVAVNREHAGTKTGTRRADHYREAIQVVRRHHGRVPLKWWLAQPYAVWYRSLVRR